MATEALVNLDLLGYRIVAHVHEVIIEVPDDTGTIEDIDEVLAIGADRQQFWMATGHFPRGLPG